MNCWLVSKLTFCLTLLGMVPKGLRLQKSLFGLHFGQTGKTCFLRLAGPDRCRFRHGFASSSFSRYNTLWRNATFRKLVQTLSHVANFVTNYLLTVRFWGEWFIWTSFQQPWKGMLSALTVDLLNQDFLNKFVPMISNNHLLDKTKLTLLREWL